MSSAGFLGLEGFVTVPRAGVNCRRFTGLLQSLSWAFVGDGVDR